MKRGALINQFVNSTNDVLGKARLDDIRNGNDPDFVMDNLTPEEATNAINALQYYERKLTSREEWIVHQYLNFVEGRICK